MSTPDPALAFTLERLLASIPEPANGETYSRYELHRIVVAALKEAASPVVSISVRAADA